MLARLNSPNTNAQKVHVKQRPHYFWRGSWSINDNDYAIEIKQVEEDLACINVNGLDDDLVSITLNCFRPDYKSLHTSFSV